MKKIVHLTSVHSRYDVRIFLKECVTLADSGYEVYLVVADGLGDEVKRGVQIIDSGQRPKSRIGRMLYATKNVYKAARDISADLYHFHDPELIPVGLRLKKTGSIVVFDSHENYSDDIKDKSYLPAVTRPLVSFFYRVYESLLIQRLDAVIAATPSIRRYFEAKGALALDVNNFPFEDEFSPSVENLNKQFDAIYIGSISRIRGVKELVDAFALLNGRKLLIAGTFSEPSFEKEIKNSEGWKSVEFWGQVDRQAVKMALAQSRAAIVTFLPVPNHIESQPNKMFEYMSSGLPLICSNFPLWTEIVEDNKCGVCVDPSSPNDIAKAIDHLIDNCEVAKTMGEHGREAILERYNWTLESKKLLDFYTKLFDKQL